MCVIILYNEKSCPQNIFLKYGPKNRFIAQSYRYKPSKKLVPSKIISDQSDLGWYERDCHFSQVTLNCPKGQKKWEIKRLLTTTPLSDNLLS